MRGEVVAMKLIRSIDRKFRQSIAAHAHTVWKLQSARTTKTDNNLIECLFWEQAKKNKNSKQIKSTSERKRERGRVFECGRTRPRANYDTRALSIGSALPATVAVGVGVRLRRWAEYFCAFCCASLDSFAFVGSTRSQRDSVAYSPCVCVCVCFPDKSCALRVLFVLLLCI